MRVRGSGAASYAARSSTHRVPSSRIGLAIRRRPVSSIARMNGGYEGSCNRTASLGSLNAMTEEAPQDHSTTTMTITFSVDSKTLAELTSGKKVSVDIQ